jgi:hypothetical protein
VTVRKVYCLNGHDASGVDGFTCLICRAELRTVLIEHRARPVRPERLMAVSVLPAAAFVALVATRAQAEDAADAAVLISLALVGAALWLAACMLGAVAVARSGNGPGPYFG